MSNQQLGSAGKADLIFSLDGVTVREGNHLLLSDLNFQIRAGEHLALVGESGSGKSALLETIAGKRRTSQGRLFIADGIKGAGHQKRVALVSRPAFRSLNGTEQFYYQQRFNSAGSEDALTVVQYLDQAFPKKSTNVKWELQRTVEMLRLGPLLDKQLIKLSNGETKRLLIAAALLKQPEILLLDNPMIGLDVNTRASFQSILAAIAGSGITLIIATSPKEIPEVMTHVAAMHGGSIIRITPAADFLPSQVTAGQDFLIDTAELTELLSLKIPEEFEYVVQMNNVSVRYGEKIILDQVNWTIKQGEHWALLGPNGAGKSTLLSLINGDNPQAYANNIILFDRRRGTGESIWDIKRKTGFVSPELHLYFPTENNCLQVIESGFYDTLGMFRVSNPANAAIALRWMKLLELEQVAQLPLKSVSMSTQRRVLLARALVKNPSLLIFDEPCQGLDQHQQQLFKLIVDAICRISHVTLIYVSHYENEIPDSVNQVLKLTLGKVVS